MKKIMLTMVLAMITMLIQAQEVMKVELKKGETVEYKVDDIKRVYFDIKTPSDDDDIKTNYLIMYVGDKEEIEGTVVTATSENDFVASVEGNVVTANHKGSTVIVVNEKHPVIIMVFSLRTSIPDPVLKWDEPKDTIKAYHTKGTIYQDDDETLVYQNCGDAKMIGYTFDEEGKLSSAAVGVESSKALTLLYYLRDRYYIYPEKQSNGYYLGFDGYDEQHIKTVIMYSTSDNLCVFLPYAKYANNNSESRKIFSKIMDDWESEKE